MTAYELKNIAILNVGGWGGGGGREGADFRCILWGITKDEAINRLNNLMLENKGVIQNGFWCK